MAVKKAVVLSATELNDLKSEKKELEGNLRNMEDFGKGTAAEGIDKGQLNSQIKRLDAVIHQGTAPEVRGVRKDSIAREAADLAGKIQKGMPTYDEMRSPTKNPGAIHKNQLWEKNNKQNIERWKQLQRTLEPNDPTTSNVERLRSK